ncbi:MAG: dihydrodipicolinate synthase family protein [Thermoflexales bacterium]|nr:dihydrodipicolinate synthase family protein [Thermoflexales bacterium]
MQLSISLPTAGGSAREYALGEPKVYLPGGPFQSRIAFAAAHVMVAPGSTTAIDWEATMAYRRHLWSYGFAVAEAMDTAQRGMGLDWAGAKELIRRSVAEAAKQGATVFSGAGTDHLAPAPDLTLDEVTAAYLEQIGYIESLGGRIILMASRALAACARGPEDYAQVYARVLGQTSKPVILHWLGDMFDPKLAGYWGARDLSAAMDTCLGIIRANAARIDGIKISLLDAQREIDMRRRLPPGVRMYTGDDFNYPELIKGDALGYSHALLGIFDAIAPAAAAAFHALDRGDLAAYDAILEPTVALSRHIFQTPTYSYKTGVAFLAWLNGYQARFEMLGGQETARSRQHLAELFILADRAGLLRDPDLAVQRMNAFLS